MKPFGSGRDENAFSIFAPAPRFDPNSHFRLYFALAESGLDRN
jgi:hypothetical protein